MKKIDLMNVVYVVVTAFIIIAISVFGFGKNNEGHTGFQIISGNGFWYGFWMIFFALLGAAALVYAVAYYRRTQDFSKGFLLTLVVAVSCIAIAFGKGCTDKANDGVTSPGGRPGGAEQVDSTRQAAEDMIPK